MATAARYGSKRIPGPDVSYPAPRPAAAAGSGESSTRPGGRGAEQLRPMFLRTGVVTQAGGSAYWEAGNLKLMAAVYGPRPSARHLQEQRSDMALLHCHVHYLPFACKGTRIPLGTVGTSHPGTREEREFSAILQQALAPAIRLHLYPKAVLDVYVYILERDGGYACLAGAINCASLALVQAGIEMVDVVAACSAGFVARPLPEGGSSRLERLLDVEGKEEEVDMTAASGKSSTPLQAQLLVAYMPTFREVTHLKHVGKLDFKLLNKSVDVLLQQCEQVQGLMKNVLTTEQQQQEPSS